jgi:hypothetical protein
MTNAKQIQANRINAVKGGVKTDAGKAKSRLNAVSHGFFSKELVLPGEDERLLSELRDNLFAEVQPAGEMERLFLEIIISAVWRIKRLLNFERKNVRLSTDYRYPTPDKIMQYINTLQRQIYKAIHELERLQNARIKDAGSSAHIDSILNAISGPSPDSSSSEEQSPG